MQTKNNAPIEQVQINFVEERIKAEKQQKGGANWFFWIAGLSVVNSVILIAGGNLNFIIGLGITQIVDGIAMALANSVDPGSGTIIRVLALFVNLVIAGIFAIFGSLARKKYKWSFVIGMSLYAADSLIFLIIFDILSMGFHLIALYGLYRGLIASQRLDELQLAPPRESVTQTQGTLSTSKLFWGMIWRSSAWGILTGGIGGAVYATLLMAASLVSEPISSSPVADAEAFVSGIGVWVLSMLLVALAGGVSGNVIGLVFGPIGGLLCALLTRLFFFPLRDVRIYRWLVGISGGIYGVIVMVTSILLWAYLILLVFPEPTGNETYNIDYFVGVAVVGLCFLPELIGGLACVLISQLIAGWYGRESKIINAM